MGRIRLFETFAGVGMQRRGVQNAGYDVENVGISELDSHAIISYAAIHEGLTMDMVDNYDNYPSREQMAEDLTKMNINYDFKNNKPYNWNKLANGKSKNLEKIWLACKLSKNFGDVSCIDTIPECDLLSFSFPCQDLSVAGAQRGLIAGETRSGLVYEVIRILKNMKAQNKLPKFLLMENVDALINKKNKPAFELLNEEFDEIGYNVYYDVINTKNCSYPERPTPQNRNRCFGMYIRKDLDNKKFTFPIPFDSGIRLKDILFDKVDESYYIRNAKAQQLIDKLIENNEIPSNGSNQEGVDCSINDPKIRDISNCIAARQDRGISNHKQEGTCVVETQTA